MSGLSSLPFLLILVIALFFILLPILAILDIVKRGDIGARKVLWVVIILFVPVLGSILYFLVRPGRG